MLAHNQASHRTARLLQTGKHFAAATNAVTAGGTQVMGVRNTAFILEKLASETSPVQLVRELTQNSFEADSTNVFWGYDEAHFEATGVRKLSITDNGKGMTPDQMIEYLNNLSSSGKIQALDENFGIGTKATACVKSPHGVIYRSWVGGQGYEICVWKDSQTGEYGLKPLRRNQEGNAVFYKPLPKSAKPEMMGESGTQVTLLGQNAKHDTFAGINPDVKEPAVWVQRALNDRYAKIKDGVELKVLEDDFYRTIKGLSYHSALNSRDSGAVALSDATVHWYVLKARGKDNRYTSAGHIAACHKNELFDLKHGPAAISRMMDFGIYVGASGVIMHVDARKASSTLSRNKLTMKNGDDLPWDRWAVEFNDKMPQGILDYLAGFDAGLQNGAEDIDEAVATRLQKFSELLSRTGPVPTPSGEGGGGGGGGGGTPPVKKPSPEKGDGEKKVYGPKVIWVSHEKGTLQNNEELAHRAAAYSPAAGLLKINADHPAFADIMPRVLEMRRNQGIKDNAQTTALLEQNIRILYQSHLAETISRGIKYVDKSDKPEEPGKFSLVPKLREAFTMTSLTTACFGVIDLVEIAMRQAGYQMQGLRRKAASDATRDLD